MTNVVADYGWEASNPQSCGYIAPEILRILAKLNVRRICDLGSGNGTLVGLLGSAGYEASGVEYDQQGVEISKTNYPKAKFYHLGVDDDPSLVLNTEGRVFDAVVSTEVIEHLFSPQSLPKFARKIVDTGGYIIVSTPYHGYIKNLALSVFNKWDKHHTALWHGGHIKFWSKKTLTQLLEQNGFKAVGFYGTGRLPWIWKSMIIVAKAV